MLSKEEEGGLLKKYDQGNRESLLKGDEQEYESTFKLTTLWQLKSHSCLL